MSHGYDENKNSNSELHDARIAQQDGEIVYDVIIVGAGISGLAAAQRLLQQYTAADGAVTKRIKLLEARERPGGRVNPKPCPANLVPVGADTGEDYGDVRVACGANWIHDLRDSNPMFRLAKQLNLLLYNCVGDHEIDTNARIADRRHFDRTGEVRFFSVEEIAKARTISERIERGMGSKFYEMCQHEGKGKSVASPGTPGKTIARMRRSYSDECGSSVAIDDMPVSEVLSEIIDQLDLTAEELELLPLIQWQHEQYGIAAASDLQKLSFVNWHDTEDDAEFGEGLVALGTAQLLSPLLKGVDIEYNCVVQEVVYSEGRSAEHTRNPIVLVTSSGEKKARNVIMAVPLGVLKQKRIQFEPPLSTRREQFFASVTPGLMDIVVLRFRKRFWPENVFVFGVPPTPNGTFYHGVYGIPANSAENSLSSDSIFTSFMNLSAVRPDGCPLLLAQIYDSRAREIEGMTIEEIAAAATKTLRCIFGDEMEDPIGCVTHGWGKDEFAYGSWMKYDPGADREEIQLFQRPLLCHRSAKFRSASAVSTNSSDSDSSADHTVHREDCNCIQFCGEWSHPTHYGLMQGAHATGIRAAEHIISHDSLDH